MDTTFTVCAALASFEKAAGSGLCCRRATILIHVKRRARAAGIALGLLLEACASSFALNPSLDVSQYGHNAWTTQDGFLKGNIYAIAQTPDGYLWLGTEFGLFRFDGVRGIPWQPPAGQHLPDQNINTLPASRDGTLWIGTFCRPCILERQQADPVPRA